MTLRSGPKAAHESLPHLLSQCMRVCDVLQTRLRDTEFRGFFLLDNSLYATVVVVRRSFAAFWCPIIQLLNHFSGPPTIPPTSIIVARAIGYGLEITIRLLSIGVRARVRTPLFFVTQYSEGFCRVPDYRVFVYVVQSASVVWIRLMIDTGSKIIIINMINCGCACMICGCAQLSQRCQNGYGSSLSKHNFYILYLFCDFCWASENWENII